MRQLFQHTLLSFFILLLAACGGGGSFDGESTGGGTTPTPVIKITLTLVDPITNEEIKHITATPGGVLKALVTIDDIPQVNVKVDFSLPDGVGELSQTSAATETDGVASVDLTAGSVTNAGTVIATYNSVESIPLVFTATASVIDTNVTVAMSQITTTPNSIGPNGTAKIEVSFTQTTNGVTEPLAQSIPVEFSSNCASAATPLAVISTDIKTFDGKAVATYEDKGCGQEDDIQITATIGQQQIYGETSLNVVGAEAHSIQFKSISSEVIAIKGTGGIGRGETSTLVFVVKDSIDNFAREELVNFSLSTDVGGITLSSTSKSTNSQGEVSVIVRAGSVATPVVVVATLANNNDISTVSSNVSVSTGAVDSNSFSISVSDFNPEGLNIDGVQVTVTARLADHFNNPVPDGRTVEFKSEFGSIEPQCFTVNGLCTVTWTSQQPKAPDPAFRDGNAITRRLGNSNCYNGNIITNLSNTSRPCPGTLGSVYGQRVTIFAHSLGEETFSDANGNGRFDEGEAYTDLAEAFQDNNNDGVYSHLLGDGSAAPGAFVPGDTLPSYLAGKTIEVGGDNEEYADDNGNQEYDGPNGQFNGIACNDAEAGCSKNLVSIGKSIVILQSGSHAQIGLIESTLNIWEPTNYFQAVNLYTITTPDDPATPAINEEVRVKTTKQVSAYIADIHNGSMPSGTVIEFETTNGTIKGQSTFTVGSSNAHGINNELIVIEPDDESNIGLLTVSVTTPGGTTRKSNIVIND